MKFRVAFNLINAHNIKYRCLVAMTDSGGDLRTMPAAEAENACNKVNAQKVDGETA